MGTSSRHPPLRTRAVTSRRERPRTHDREGASREGTGRVPGASDGMCWGGREAMTARGSCVGGQGCVLGAGGSRPV